MKLVEKVILGDKKNIINSIDKVKPKILCIGYDQKIPEKIQKYCEENKIKIVKIKKKYNETKCKSSIIKERILKEE